MNYPKEFVQQVKESFSGNEEVYKLLEEDPHELGNYLLREFTEAEKTYKKAKRELQEAEERFQKMNWMFSTWAILTRKH